MKQNDENATYGIRALENTTVSASVSHVIEQETLIHSMDEMISMIADAGQWTEYTP